MINYRTIQDLNLTIRKNLHKIPSNIEVVAGVHRSGQLAAQIIGAHLNLPIISFRNLRETHWVYTGYRGFIEPEDQEEYLRKVRNVLVVDDANTSGQTIMKEQELYEQARISQSRPEHNILYMSVYPASRKVKGIDMYFEIVPGPRMFEWNWNNHSLTGKACMDLDGVLCHDPTTNEWDEKQGAKQYRAFMKTAKPLYMPKRGLRHVVTSRLEKWREETVGWLRKHRIDYGTLHMMQVNTPEEREAYGAARYKAETYQHLSELQLFFESDINHAREIFDRTKRPVFCVDTRELLQKG